MGEARRRRERMAQQAALAAGQAPVPVVRQSEATTRQYLVQIADLMVKSGYGKEHHEAQVPCGGCRECCWFPRVDVDPNQESPERLAKLDLEHDAEGYFLRKRADGACIHLRENGCTVYEYRPHSCREFDCRRLTLTGTGIKFGHGHVTPVWEFPASHPEDQAILLAFRIGAAQAIKEDEKVDSGTIFGLAVRDFWKNLPMARRITAQMETMPPAASARLRSFLKRGEVQERFLELVELNRQRGATPAEQ